MPDATTLLQFRRLLQDNDLSRSLYDDQRAPVEFCPFPRRGRRRACGQTMKRATELLKQAMGNGWTLERRERKARASRNGFKGGHWRALCD